MALVKFLRGVTVMLILSANVSGSHSQQLGCGRGTGNPQSDNWPWRALIANPGSLSNCSGSLITEQWVMTSNDCDIRSEGGTWVHLGERSNSFPNLYEESVSVEDIRCSDDMNALLMMTEPGVCLMKLSKPVNITGSIGTVCLAAQNSATYSGMKSYIANGPTSAARMEVPIVGRNVCRCKRPDVRPDAICAGRDLKMRPSTDCMKNVGGALMAYENNAWTQIGISQYDQRCPPTGHVTTYTDLSLYEQWIRDVTGMSKPGFNLLSPNAFDPDIHFWCDVPQTTFEPMPSTNRPPKPYRCKYPSEYGCRDDYENVFDSGVDVMHSSPFILLCVLFLSFFGTFW